MYILSKSIYFLINPIVWVTALLALALFRKKNQRKYLKWGFFMFLFFSLAPIFQIFAWMWEVPLTDMRTMEKEYDIGIVLGGFSRGDVKPFDRLHFTSSATRVTTAIELYEAGKIKKILVTGGSFSVQEGQLAEGERTRLFLEKIGIPPEDIIIENKSLNTRENATLTKKLIDAEYSGSTCLLITSAFHMRRSKKCFEKVDLDCDTFSTSPFSTRINKAIYYYPFPNGSVLESWQMLMKEWVGYVMYKMVGYI
jgi:uncharacterized SAM-binding protein YcdF (DUF218 family)